MPSGLTIDSSKTPDGTNSSSNAVFGIAEGFNGTNYSFDGQVTYGDASNNVRILASAGDYWRINVPFAAWNSSSYLTVNFTVPIAEWAGTGTVQLAQNDVEYASNSSATTTSDSTTFAYGPSGSLIQAFAPTGLSVIQKRVRFQTPIQPGDQLLLEVDEGTNGARWSSMLSRIGPRGVNTAGTVQYGATIVNVNNTDADVQFAATYDAYTSDTWSTLSTWRWRVRKSSAGAAVGFGIVQPGVSSGLVSSLGLPGKTDGLAVTSGYVGEEKSASATTVSIGTTETDLVTLTLTDGIWLVSATSYSDGNTGVTGSTAYLYVKNVNSNTNGKDVLKNYDDGATGVRFASSLTFGARPITVFAADANKTVKIRAKTIAGTSNFSGFISAVRIA